MKTTQLNWQSQRNHRRWAVIWFGLLLILSAITACSVQPRYHQRGWHIQISGNHHPSMGQKRTSNFKESRLVEQRILEDTADAMHISQRLIKAGKYKTWVYRDTAISTFITKQLRTMTIIGDTFTMHGKLVAANERGIFLYNPHDPLFWVSKKPYGKTQTAIRDKILFVPYTDIQKIKKGGTLASRLERILNGLFWIWFSISGALGGFWAIVTFGNSNWIGADALEALIFVVVLIAYIATLLITVLLSLILTPILFLLQLPVAKLKGRYWRIDKDSNKGQMFFEFIKRKHQRYRLFRRDIDVVKPSKTREGEEIY